MESWKAIGRFKRYKNGKGKEWRTGKDGKMKKKRLSEVMLFLPIWIIITMFILVSLTFHFIIDRHIHSLTRDGIDKEFEIMDEVYHQNGSQYIISDREEPYIIVPTEYLILDENGKILFFSEREDIEEGREKGRFISKYIMEHGIFLKEKAQKISIFNKTFLVSGKYYQGIFDYDAIIEAENGEVGKKYLYLVYVDITALQRLADTMNQSLMVIIICIGGMALFFMIQILKRVSISFDSLDKYLIQIGNREEIKHPPAFSYQEFSNIVDTVENMSERIRQSEQLQKQFFQNASHELRTPLMSIQGYAEGLKYNVMKNPENSCDIILKESKRMSDLVDEILFLSKFEAKELKKEEISVEDILYSCGNQVYIKNQHKHLKILWEIPKGLIIYGDETMLQRAFSNILSNALRYAKTQVRIIVLIEEKNIVVHIIDDGKGISAEELPHIFERFYKGKGGNFGIGLSMAKYIIEKHGGKILVLSQKSCTDFSIIIPRE